MRAVLWEGGFATRERVRLWSLAVLVGTLAAIVWLAISAHGLSDYRGRPLGTDFSDVYAAGMLAREGNASAAYDWPRHYAEEQAIFGRNTPFYGWHYPPFFLIAAQALAHLPYLTALLLWQGLTLLLYAFAMRALLRSRDVADPLWMLAALAFPAVFVNLTHGQNGFLSAALLAGGLALLQPRPFLAGLLFGLMAYKPQFVAVIPVALLAARQWRALAGLVLSVATLTISATALFGFEIWSAFLQSAHLSRTVVLEQGNTGFEKMQSVFAFVRLLGGGVPLAYALQGATSLAVLTALVIVWRKPALHNLKGALLCFATTLSTPYSLDYDLMVLAPGIALLVADGQGKGFRNGEITLLSALWLIPFAARSIAGATHLVLVPLLLLTASAFVLRRRQFGICRQFGI